VPMSSIKNTFFGGAEKRAGEIQERGARRGITEQRRQFDITQEQLAPFREAGISALEQQQQFLGLLGPEQQQVAFEQFQESPGQKFLRERQEQSLIRNQTALGGIGGGNIRTALQEQAVGIAGTQLGEFQNRLAGISGAGQTTTTNVAQLGAQTATNIQQGLQTAAAGAASGITGQAAGQRAGVGQVAQLAGFFSTPTTLPGARPGFPSDIRLKTNIVKIDELKSGLNWYMWDWIESAKRFVGDQPRSGVIAQEAVVLFPNAVFHKDGYLNVDYRDIY